MTGLVKYLFGPGRFEEHVGQRVVAGSDPTWVGAERLDPVAVEGLIAELDLPTLLHGNRSTAGHVFHLVVSIPAADGGLSDGQWQQTAQMFADRLGFDEQVGWLAVHHGPSGNGNDHVHMVANLIRGDGRVHRLPFERMRRREVCLDLEQRFGLTATAPAGLGQGGLARAEVEQLRAGQVADAADLGRLRLATTVRAVAAAARSEPEFVERLRGEGIAVAPRYATGDPAVVTGYRIAARTVEDQPLVWFGGGRLGKDLRLPALRDGWAQTAGQRAAAAEVWTSQTGRAPKAQAVNIDGTAEALRAAAAMLAAAPKDNRALWEQAATQSAGMLAAAAAVTEDPRARRELVRAWQAVDRATPATTSARISTASTDGAPAPNQAGAWRAAERPRAAWPQPTTGPPYHRDLAMVLSGAARVVMATRLADAPDGERARALIVQVVQTAVQINQAIAARAGATAAQQRAAEATGYAAAVQVMPAGWQFRKSGTQMLLDARKAHTTELGSAVAQTHGLTQAQDVGVGY